MRRTFVGRVLSALLFVQFVGATLYARDAGVNNAVADAGGASDVWRSARGLCDEGDAVSRRVLREYGAVFLASGEVLPPPACIFSSAAEVALFQAEAQTRTADIGGARVELQTAAMRALLFACEEARAAGLSITPRDGAEAARRNYADTVRLWQSRLLPALEHWARRGRLTSTEAARLRRLPLREQVGAVLELEGRGLLCGKGFAKSILHSVAAPGASQHLSLLAFDVSEFAEARVRRILARHGWFRTVRDDAPHFTYLGLPEALLPSRGLKRFAGNGGEFWVPDENIFSRRATGRDPFSPAKPRYL